MEYLFFIIYGVIMAQLFTDKGEKKSTSYVLRGRSYYRTKGILNLIAGFIGMMLSNHFLRDKEIIPVWSFWFVFAGFAFLFILGTLYMIKVMMSEHP